ncbi:MAG: TetR/AcrR family transcriptional regulator [Bacteroidota bacterium]
MGHVDRKQRDKEEIKKRILGATLKIGKKEGWQSVTIRKIADEIEYTPPIVYEHFESKEDLIRELIHGGFKMLKEEFVNANKTESEAKPLLRKLSLIHWDFASNNLALYQLMFRPEKPALSEEFINMINIVNETFMKLAKNNKTIAEELNINWFCLIHGAISLMMTFPPPPHFQEVEPSDLFANMIDRFIESI